MNVLTQHNDNARTGANLSETTLTTSNVNVNTFGKLWSYPVTGQVYAQPLIVQGVNIGGTTHNVVFVATMHNNVYAFDADRSGAALWSVNLGTSVALPSSNLGTTGPCRNYQDILGEIGIMSTPVIDLASNTMYVEAKTHEGTAYVERLHALDITTGAEKMGGPVQITASNGTHTIDGLRASQRASLLLTGGRVYVAFGSYCDATPYYGWLLGYSASNLAQAPVVFSTVPDGSQAGIWMSGAGPSADGSGNIYLDSGNGTFNGNTSGGRNFGNTVFKLNGSLGLVDWFTPYNQSSLNSSDLDLGSSGVLLVPGTSLLVAGGKEGKIYLLNTGNLGHFQSGSDSQIVQSFMSSGSHLHGAPIAWTGPSGTIVYVGAESDYIKGYRLNSGMFATSPFTRTSFTSPANAMPGSILSVSASGSTLGSGILWANMTISQDANHATVPGLLRAFDANNLSVELWNSQQNSSRDGLGNHAKYCPPTIANGKVYMATFSNQVVVYGLLGASTPTPTATNARPTATATGRVTPTPRGTATPTATARVTPTPTPRGRVTPTVRPRGTATATATATATPVGGATLLSQAHPVVVSSTETGTTPGSAAVDGSTSTRWSSAFGDPQWIRVDLGAEHAVSRVVLNWEAAYGKAYQVQTSNDAVTWTSIYSTTTGAGGINDLTMSGNGRYVRMYGTTRGTAYGYSLWEFQVYGQ